MRPHISARYPLERAADALRDHANFYFDQQDLVAEHDLGPQDRPAKARMPGARCRFRGTRIC